MVMFSRFPPIIDDFFFFLFLYDVINDKCYYIFILLRKAGDVKRIKYDLSIF